MVLGAPKLPLRDNWLVWQERRVPDFVLEVTSRTTRREDEGRKRRLYQRLGVAEYCQYDPTGDYLDPVLKGARLVAGAYRPIATTLSEDGAPRLASALEIELHIVRDGLRLFDPSRDRYLPVFEEETVPLHEATRRLDAAKREVADAKRQVAHARRQIAETKQRAARAERRAAQLESELRAVRRRNNADG